MSSCMHVSSRVGTPCCWGHLGPEAAPLLPSWLLGTPSSLGCRGWLGGGSANVQGGSTWGGQAGRRQGQRGTLLSREPLAPPRTMQHAQVTARHSKQNLAAR